MTASTNARKIIFIPCSGAGYNGELARQAAIRFTENSPLADKSLMLCFTIFLRYGLLKEDQAFKGMSDYLKSNFIVIIDGCSGGCALKILKNFDIKPDLVINLNKLIPKKVLDINAIQNPCDIPRLSNIKKEDLEKVSNFIVDQLKEKQIIKTD
jgi:uncharacterized metal-binding protein